MLEHPKELSYTTHHTWVRIDTESGTATVGVTEDLTEQIGEVLSIDMPMIGDELDIDTYCIHLHLQTRIHHLRSPMTGRVTEINREVLDNARLLHVSPYTNWIYRMEYDDDEEVHLLMSADQYTRYLDHL